MTWVSLFPPHDGDETIDNVVQGNPVLVDDFYQEITGDWRDDHAT
jgi:hypothetical protein